MSSELHGTPESKDSEKLSFPKPPWKEKHVSPRDSYLSMVSGSSYNPSEVGQAVPLAIQESQQAEAGQVKQTYIQSQIPSVGEDDEESLLSSSTVHLGRLDTIKSSSKPNNPPEFSVDTAIDSVVPPRSRRRPLSEVVPSSEGFHSRTSSDPRHRFSLNISDDLDELMASANVLKESDSSPAESSKSNRTLSRSPNPSKDSFETATDGSSEEHAAPLSIPKRPNADSMNKARQASENHARITSQTRATSSRSTVTDASIFPQRNAAMAQGSLADKDLPNTPENEAISTDPDKTIHGQRSGSSVRSAFSFESRESKRQRDTRSSRASDGPEQESVANPGDESTPAEVASARDVSASTTEADIGAKRDVSVAGNMPNLSIGSNEVIRSNSSRQVSRSTSLHSQNSTGSEQLVGHSSIKTPTTAHSWGRNASPMPRSMPPSREEDSLRVQDNNASFRVASSPSRTLPQVPSQTKEIQGHPKLEDQPERTTNAATGAADDDGFSDIEEPVLMSPPTRAKSVKDNTKMPRVKSSQRKSRRTKNRSTVASATTLKPFSYNTLVHLLESVNGTVIGEEFEGLDLPIQEKQLIEKIVDSLSRLTSDMVTDKNRFAIGIERLEKAHRVLEGFL